MASITGGGVTLDGYDPEERHAIFHQSYNGGAGTAEWNALAFTMPSNYRRYILKHIQVTAFGAATFVAADVTEKPHIYLQRAGQDLVRRSMPTDGPFDINLDGTGAVNAWAVNWNRWDLNHFPALRPADVLQFTVPQVDSNVSPTGDYQVTLHVEVVPN